MIDKTLGSKMQVTVFACKGEMNRELCDKVSNKIITSINMTPVDCISSCWKYPIGEEELGGLGMTIMQPLTESFAIFDTYDPLNGGYYFLASCKAFDSFIVKKVLEGYFNVVDWKEISISLI